MGLKIEYDLDLAQPTRALNALSDIDKQQLAEDIGELLLEETLFNFEKEQSPTGEKWTQSQRAADGGKTLQDFGHLRDSIVYLASSDGVEIGSALVYAAIHQFGGNAGRNNSVEIEARPFLGLNDSLETEIGEMVTDAYEQALKGN